MANNKLITSYFRLHSVNQFIESIDEPANTIYYVFGGKPTQYSLGDATIDAPNGSIESLNTKVYDEMVFAKKINTSDVAVMANRYTWTSATVYDMYDSQYEIEDKQFFAISPEGGTYYIYKCLFNNNDSPATSQPLFSATGADDVSYETADGYIWKYLYKVDATTFNKFSTSLYMPVIVDANVTSNAVSGAIDVIKIESGGLFYNNYLSGSFTSTDTRFGGLPLKYRIIASDASSTNDFYRGCIIKIITGTGVGQYRKITSYTTGDEYKFIFIDTPFTVTPSASTFEIMPEVTVYGDGRQTSNVEARALINSTSSNTIYKIDILNRGAGYFVASANAFASPVVRTSNTVNDASLRPIISPRGGHGYDVAGELYATHLGISVKFSNNENNTISTDNDFRTVGVIKDPRFYNVKLNYDSLLGSGFTDTENIVQLDIKRLGGSVSVTSTSKNVVGLGTLTTVGINSAGNTIFANTDVITISNVAVNAICNIVSNSTGFIASISVVSAGFGFSDIVSPVISIANASGGNVRFVNSNIITATTASANGRGYSNADFVIVSSTSATINAQANITTNSIGGITSLLITNSGKDFNLNEIAIITITANGRGYDSTVNNQLAFTGGGGTGAIAAFTNNATGNLVSITLSNPGTAYTSTPTANAIGTSPSVVATFSVRMQSNGLSVTIANSTGGYSNGAKVVNTTIISNGSIGLYANTDYIVFPSPSAITGNAFANVFTSTDGSMALALVNATVTTLGNNFGFTLDPTAVLTPFVANSTGGRIRYLNSNIVNSITVSNSAPAYRIGTVTITANGQNYNSTKVLRVDVADGGIGYNSIANNILIFTGGAGSGANAIFVNNSLGSIISVTMVANGTGYTSVPTISTNATANGIGANLVPVLANSLTFTSTSSGYGAIAFFTNNASGNIASIVVSNNGFGYTGIANATISDPVGTGVTFTVAANSAGILFNASDVLFVTNGSVNAVANIAVNATSFMTSLDVKNSGLGFSPSTLFIYAANSSGGNTRYFNNTVIDNISVVSGGYTGFCSNSDVLTISNGSINSTANIVSNTVGGLSTINLIVSGLGFANHSSLVMKLTNATSGDIRFLNDYIVNSYSISDGGSGYNNTDVVIISSTGAINATANIVTSTTGTISDIQFNNRGKGILPSYISNINIVTGGTGYSNADKIVLCGGGGTGANAILLTNATGGIVRTYVVSGGINYNCAPTITIANSSGGVANGSSANLTSSTTNQSFLRIYDANNNPSSGEFADLSFTVSLSANASAILAYSPTLAANLATAADISVTLGDSANLFFTSTKAPNVSINLTGQTTSFSSSLGAGDYVYLQTNDNQSQLLQVNSVTNSSHLILTSFPAFSSNAVAISAANVQASGNVLDKSAGYVEVTNVVGFFTQANIIYGLSSESSSNVTAISFNGVSKTGATVNQLFYYGITSTTGTFQEDEVVYASGSTARFHSGNGSAIFVTNQTDLFYPGNTVTGNTSGATAVLSSGSSYKYEGDFIRGSGDVIYIENIEPISRSNTQSETIKLIVEF
jgi:hypothetical protein